MILFQNLLRKSKGGLQNLRGTITVFISIVLSAIFLMVGTFTDAARFRMAESHVDRAGRTALSSILASYNNELKDQYGLFGLYLDNGIVEDTFDEYFRKNLSITKQNFLYGFKIENTNVELSSSLLNKEILQKQIIEFMKYRAPYEIALDLTNKIDGIKNISKGAQAYKRKLETDKQAGKIGDLQLSLEEKTKKINSSEIVVNVSELKDKYTSQSNKQAEFSNELSRLQILYQNEKSEKKKKKLLLDINKIAGDIDIIAKEKSLLKNTIIESVKEYKSLNSQAIDEAKSIAGKKKGLLTRIDNEIEYTKDNLNGIKELQHSYKENLVNMKEIIKEDNSDVIIDTLSGNINNCESIVSSTNINENEFLKALDGFTVNESINYSFNKTKPVQSDDEDIRDDVIYAMQEAFRPKSELISIDSSLLYMLPSRNMYEEENQVITWNNMNMEDVTCATANLDYISSKADKFEQIVSSVAEQLYINEYIMGTFRHDVQRLKGEAEKDSYNLRSKNKQERDAYFSQFEVEYIINGNRSEKINSLLVQSEIVAIRLISNVIHVYTDSSKMVRINSLAAALSTWSAGLSTPLMQTMLVFSWAMAESLYDMDQFAKGEKIALFKTREQWRTDLSGAVSKSKAPNVENNPLCLSYQDYLKIFLLLMDNDKKLARVQDLVQLNIGVSSQGFLLKECRAVIKADTTISMKNIFISLPKLSRYKINKSISIGY